MTFTILEIFCFIILLFVLIILIYKAKNMKFTKSEIFCFIIPLIVVFGVLIYNTHYNKNKIRNIPIIVIGILLYKILLKSDIPGNTNLKVFVFEFLASFLLIYTILLTGIGISNVLTDEKKSSIFVIFMLPPLMLYMLLTSSIYTHESLDSPFYGALVTPYPALMVKLTNVFFKKKQLHGPPFNTDFTLSCVGGTMVGGTFAAIIFAFVNKNLANPLL